jgi:hypothetical protein
MGNFLNLVYDDVDVTKESVINYMHSYLGIEDYRVFDINNIPNDNEKYYYFFEYRYYLASYLITEKKLPFSDTVLNLLKNNPNFNLILSNDAESDDDILIEALDVVFKNMGIDTNKIVVINCNEKNNEIKNRLNTNIITHSTNNGRFAYCNELNRFPYDYNEKRDFLFMSYNRQVKIHRFALLVKLMKHNIIDNIDWSWIRGYEVKEHMLPPNTNFFNSWYLKSHFTDEEIIEYEKEIRYLANIDKKKSVYEISYEVDFPPFKFDTEASYLNNPYSNSYINIVTETNFDKEDIILPSEKSYIPLYFSQIPIIMASRGHIKKMRELHGFDFFDDVVNHDYDNEPNNRIRFDMIINEIIRLNSRREDIEYFFNHNKERFDNNRKIVEEIRKDKKDYNFYNSLR